MSRLHEPVTATRTHHVRCACGLTVTVKCTFEVVGVHAGSNETTEGVGATIEALAAQRVVHGAGYAIAAPFVVSCSAHPRKPA